MPRLYKKNKKVALPPGTLTGGGSDSPVKIRVLDYSAETLNEREFSNIEECFSYRDTKNVSWINIDGQNAQAIARVEEHFGIHSLVLEDIINGGQRPKVEDYGDYLFFVLKMIYIDDKTKDIYSEQIALILGKNFVLSFQEKPGDVFEPVRERIRSAKGRIRKSGTDYLVYALLDAIVDNYFVILERIGEKIDALESQLLKETRSDMPLQIYQLKSKIIYLRKQIWPLREVLAGLQRMESKVITKSIDIFLRDVYDHTIQVNDTLEAFRDAISGLHDIYLSSVSNRMNEIMKVLTIFAAIFIPLTFIAGIYGMNFDNMPELHWANGYPYALGLMGSIGFGMLIYFKMKRWI